MDWHPVISVQQQTPDNDFCHFSISNVLFAFWAFFRKQEKLGSHTGSKWWPGDPVNRMWKITQMTHWPGDPVTHFRVWCARYPVHTVSNTVLVLKCKVYMLKISMLVSFFYILYLFDISLFDITESRWRVTRVTGSKPSASTSLTLARRALLSSMHDA